MSWIHKVRMTIVGVITGDPDNVLFVILGDDPRHYGEKQAEELLDPLTEWIVGLVGERKY